MTKVNEELTSDADPKPSQMCREGDDVTVGCFDVNLAPLGAWGCCANLIRKECKPRDARTKCGCGCENEMRMRMRKRMRRRNAKTKCEIWCAKSGVLREGSLTISAKTSLVVQSHGNWSLSISSFGEGHDFPAKDMLRTILHSVIEETPAFGTKPIGEQ